MSEDLKQEVKEKENKAVGTYVFKRPTMIDGKEVTEVPYDFNLIDGSAIRRAKGALTRKGYVVAVKEYDEVFLAALFAEASGLTLETVEKFALVDFMNVADLTQVFWNGEA